MAVVTLQEILQDLAKFEPEELSAEYTTLLENISDTVASNTSLLEIEKLREDLEEARRKVVDVERDWMERYKARFYQSEEAEKNLEEEILEEEEEEEEKTLEEVAEEWQEK